MIGHHLPLDTFVLQRKHKGSLKVRVANLRISAVKITKQQSSLHFEQNRPLLRI